MTYRLVILVCALVLAPPVSSPGNQSAAGLPFLRVLSEAESKQVAQLSQSMNKAVQEARFPQAAKLAADIVSIRARAQGETHWETVNARYQSKDLQLVSRLSAADRQALTAANGKFAAAQKLFADRKFPEALDTAGQARKVRVRLLGADHPDVARCDATGANCQTWMDKFDEAQAGFLRALESLTKSLGDEHPDVGACCSDLAFCFNRAGRPIEAKPYYARSFEIARRVYGDVHADTISLCQLAAFNLDRPGLYAEATEWFLAAVELTEKKLGARDPAVAERRLELARNLQSQARHADAVAQFEQAVSILRQSNGDGAAATIAAFRALANHHRFFGSLLTAQETLQVALAARLKREATEDDELADLYFELGSVLAQEDEQSAAVPNLERACDIRRRRLGVADLRVAEAEARLARTRFALGQYSQAEPLFQSALRIYRGAGKPGVAEVPLALLDLAKNYDATDRPAEARVHYEQALDAARALFGETGRNTLVFYNWLRIHLRRERHYAESDELLSRLLRIVKESTEADDFDRALLYGDLAIEERKRGNYLAGLPFAREAQRYWERVAAQTEGSLAQMMRQQGGAGNFVRGAKISVFSCLNGMGRYGEAGAFERRLLAEDLETYGPVSDQAAQDYSFLAGLCLSHGDLVEAEQFSRQWLSVANQLGAAARFPAQQAAQSVAISLDRQGRGTESRSFYQIAAQPAASANSGKAQVTIDELLLQAQLQLRIGQLAEAETLSNRAVALADGADGLDLPFLRPKAYSTLANVWRARRQFDAAMEMYGRALVEQKKLSGEVHPSYVNLLVDAAANQFGAGDTAGAERLLLEVAGLYPQVRLQIDVGGLERSGFAAASVPLNWLALLLAERGAGHDAWNRIEEYFGRGLLDDISARQSQPLTVTESQHAADVSEELRTVEERIGKLTAAIARRPQDADLPRSLEVFRARRQRLLGEWTELQSEFVKKYGPAAGEVYSLERIQAQLKPDEALVAWIDLEPPVFAPDRAGMHWACVVRHSGEPRWVRLSGTGPQGGWLVDDVGLAEQLRIALTDINSPQPGLAESLVEELRRQRFAPLEAALAADRALPAARHLVVLPSPALAAIPCELMAGAIGVSYAPSATIFALLRERRAERGTAAKTARLLAIGDPILPGAPPAQPQPAIMPPESGVFVINVQPGSTGQSAGMRSGDILLSYAGKPVKSLDELVAAIQQHSQNIPSDKIGQADTAIALWRDGKDLQVVARRGRLGVLLAPAPANVVWQELQRGRELLAQSQRSEQLRPLPGSRHETLAIARIFKREKTAPTTWLGADATEPQIDGWRRDGRLAQVRYLHFATHAVINPLVALESALVVSEPPSAANQSLTGSGDYDYDGRITAGQILREWKLNTDLVVLSACETALGQPLGGEGMLGFAQAFLRAGTQSLVVSLWRVEDQATALLMQRFYQNLLGMREGLAQPLPKAAALREAQTWLRQLSAGDAMKLLAELSNEAGPTGAQPKSSIALPAGERPFEHPGFWSAFILIGDAD